MVFEEISGEGGRKKINDVKVSSLIRAGNLRITSNLMGTLRNFPLILTWCHIGFQHMMALKLRCGKLLVYLDIILSFKGIYKSFHDIHKAYGKP